MTQCNEILNDVSNQELENYNLEPGNTNKKKKKGIDSQKKSRAIFYYALIAIPLVQFAIFYIGVNINSILLSFQSYIRDENGMYVTAFVWFKNFGEMLNELLYTAKFIHTFKNTAIMFVLNLVVIGLSLIFSYYIYKKLPLHGFFRVVLFLPQMVSSIALVLLYKYFVVDCLPAIFKVVGITLPDIFDGSTNELGAIFVYNVWAGFGTQIIIYSSTMSGISESMVEAAKIDGITPLKEFFYITIPSVFGVLTIYVVATVAGMFVHQMNLYNFRGGANDSYFSSVGYYLYASMVNPETTLMDYPRLSAFGLILTFITLPLAFGVKKLMEKYGPSEN